MGLLKYISSIQLLTGSDPQEVQPCNKLRDEWILEHGSWGPWEIIHPAVPDLRDTHTHDCTNSTKWLKLKWHAWELSAAIKYDFIKHNDVDRNSQCVILQISLLQDRVTLYNCIYIEFQGKLYKIYAYKMEVYIPTNVAR